MIFAVIRYEAEKAMALKPGFSASKYYKRNVSYITEPVSRCKRSNITHNYFT